MALYCQPHHLSDDTVELAEKCVATSAAGLVEKFLDLLVAIGIAHTEPGFHAPSWWSPVATVVAMA